jgi:hypothetical protein
MQAHTTPRRNYANPSVGNRVENCSHSARRSTSKCGVCALEQAEVFLGTYFVLDRTVGSMQSLAKSGHPRRIDPTLTDLSYDRFIPLPHHPEMARPESK